MKILITERGFNCFEKVKYIEDTALGGRPG
jgi:hypothetical protein